MLRKKEGGDLKLPLQIAAAESAHMDRAVYQVHLFSCSLTQNI